MACLCIIGDPHDGFIADNNRHPGLTPVCQTLLCDTQDVLDMVHVDSVTGGFTEKLPDTDDFYQRIVSSDEEDFSDPDDGSIADNDRHPGLTPVGQTLLCDTWDVLDMVDVDSVMGGFAEEFPDTDDFIKGCFVG